MFGFGKLPFEQRVITLVWPKIEDIQIAIPPEEGTMSQPMPLRATTAIANFSLAVALLFRSMPQQQAQSQAVKLERLIFREIEADPAFYPIGDVLRLGSEQMAWTRYSGSEDMRAESNLATILRVVHSSRIAQFQADLSRGIESFLQRGGPRSYPIVGFVAKRWLSQVSGRDITCENDLSEAGFDNGDFTSMYFSIVLTGIQEALKE